MTDYRLPHGGSVRMEVRADTNDHNVCYSIITEDEYRLESVKPLSGVALDVGAHIGAATVALCALNPDLSVVAIEALAENVELLRRNVSTNGFTERVTILEKAAGTNPSIRWNGPDRTHRFIGNQFGTGGEAVEVETVSLSELVDEYGPISFLKIDCEGCEETFLDDPALVHVDRIHGEFHNGPSVELRFQ